MDIEFDISHQILTKKENSNDGVAVNRSKNYLNCKFNFKTSDWDGLEKIASFKNDYGQEVLRHLDVVEGVYECLVPSTALRGDYFKVSVYGGDLITTNEATIVLVRSGYRNHGCGDAKDIFIDIFEDINRTRIDAQTVIDETNAAVASIQDKESITNFVSDWNEITDSRQYPSALMVQNALRNKVDKVSGKGLSTEDYTTSEKALVATIQNKVDKVSGKGLSTNDFTDSLKTKVQSIPSNFNIYNHESVIDFEHLPANPEMNKLYLIRNTNPGDSDNPYDIYIPMVMNEGSDHESIHWEKVNKASVDTSNFITKSSTAGLVKNDGSIDTSTYLTSHQDISGKVDKVAGKGLSTNDFTNDYKGKLDEIHWVYLTDGIIIEDAGAAIDSTEAQAYAQNRNEVTFISLFEVAETLEDVILTYLDKNYSGYEYVFVHFEAVAWSTGHSNMKYFVVYNPEKSEYVFHVLPQKTSDLVNDSGFLTTHQSLSNYVQKSNTAGLLKNDGTVDTTQYLSSHQDLSNYLQKSSTNGLVKNDGSIDTSSYLTSHQDISGKADKADFDTLSVTVTYTDSSTDTFSLYVEPSN